MFCRGQTGGLFVLLIGLGRDLGHWLLRGQSPLADSCGLSACVSFGWLFVGAIGPRRKCAVSGSVAAQPAFGATRLRLTRSRPPRGQRCAEPGPQFPARARAAAPLVPGRIRPLHDSGGCGVSTCGRGYRLRLGLSYIFGFRRMARAPGACHQPVETICGGSCAWFPARPGPAPRLLARGPALQGGQTWFRTVRSRDDGSTSGHLKAASGFTVERHAAQQSPADPVPPRMCALPQRYWCPICTPASSARPGWRLRRPSDGPPMSVTRPTYR